MKKTIESVVNEVLCDHGILRTAHVEQVKRKPSFEAFTDLSTRQATVRYDPDFVLSRRARVFARKKNVAQPLETCVRDVAKHECGHVPNRKRRACPGTVDEHEEYFYEPIAAVLRAKGKLEALDGVCNLAQDLIDNTLLARGEHAGLSLFYHDVAESVGWQPAYEAYMRVQLYFWGDSQDHKLLTFHFKNNEDVRMATQSFIRTIERVSGKGKRLAHEEIAAYVANKECWTVFATEFAKALEPLLPPQPNLPMCGFGKQMKKEMQDPANRERFARRRYEQGKSAPSWMEQEESLDAVYSALARQIQVKVESPRKATSFPVVPYQHAPFDPEEHEISRVNFKKPLLVPEQDTPFGIPGFSFGVPQHFIEKPLLVKKGITSFPEFKCAYVDCSGTMQEGLPVESGAGSMVFIPWGDKSKYHYVCKTWYGIVEYLGRQGILPNVNVSLGTFSSTSAVRHGLEASKKLLFNPQWGNTNIDVNAIDELLLGSKSVFFTVSDGGVQNWNVIKTDFIARAKNHFYFHIQLGKHTEMTRDLKKAGLAVYTVNTGEDFERLAIDLTHNAYQSYMDETLEQMV